MSQIREACWECQKTIKVEIGQVAFDYQLGYSLSYNCPYCGAIAELDDVGFPPEDIRQYIINQEGKYFLKIGHSNAKNKVISMKIIRQALELSIPEVLNLFNSYSNIAEGTKVEVKWLQKLLVDR